MGENTQDRDQNILVQKGVDVFYKALKTEQIVTYWVRTYHGKVSGKFKRTISELIDLHMTKKKDDRIVIDYLISDEVVGKTDLGDPDILMVITPNGKKMWIADYVNHRDEYDSLASDEIKRLHRKVKDRDAVIDSLSGGKYEPKEHE